jgi:hypothetical protein
MKSRRDLLANTAGMAAIGAGTFLGGEKTAYAVTPSDYPFYNVKDFGAVGNGTADDTTSIQNAVNTAATTGGVVYFPPGNYPISSTINMLNWVALKGEGRASKIIASAGFSQQQMFYAANGTNSMFYSRLDDLWLHANDVAAILYVVQAVAWQESSGANRLLVTNFRNTGILLSNGFGGAAWTRLSEVEVFGSPSGAQYGIRCTPMGTVGAFMLSLSGASIAGASASAPLSSAILVEGNSVVADTLHFENCSNGVQISGISNVNIRGVTGSSEAVGNVVVLASDFSGSAVLQTINPNGASCSYLNNKTGSISTTTVAHLVVQQ